MLYHENSFNLRKSSKLNNLKYYSKSLWSNSLQVAWLRNQKPFQNFLVNKRNNQNNKHSHKKNKSNKVVILQKKKIKPLIQENLKNLI